MKKLKPLQRHQGVNLTAISTAVEVNASKEKAWKALSNYGNVSDFHAGVEHSAKHLGHTNTACLGAERTCDILDGKTEIMLKERITEYEEGEFYRYEVFEWKNFPLKKMFFAFQVQALSENKTELKLTINYRLSPGFLTGLMKWKIRQLERRVLTGYRHYMETGDKRVELASINELNYQFA